MTRTASPARRRAGRLLLAGLSTLLLATGCGAGGEGATGGAATAAPEGPGTSAPGAAPVAATPDGLVPADVAVPAGLGAAPFDTPRQALLPPGWTMSVWARVPQARLETWAPDGSMLVSVPETGEILRLVPGAGGAPPTTSTLLAGLTQPHGMAFDGSTLYVAESDAVSAFTYADGTATAPRVVASGLPDAKSPELQGRYAHALKTVVVGPDRALYVSVGSTGNVSPEDREADPERASILRIPPGGGAPQTFARGVRNGTGLAFAPDGTLWSAVNNRDNIPYPYQRPYGDATSSSFGQVIPQYVDNHPPEELAAITPGRDLGWPYCNPEPDVEPGVAGSERRAADLPFVADAGTNPGGARLDCSRLAPLEQSYGAHSAPLGLNFADVPGFGTGVLSGVHGSWNRTAPRAPEVSFHPWADGRMGDQRTIVGGFQAPDGSRWGRPVAAVTGPDGAIYVSDDVAGAIYRVVPSS